MNGVPADAHNASPLHALNAQCERLFSRYGLALGCAVAFLLPIRLIFAWFAFAALLILWVFGPARQTLRRKEGALLPEVFLAMVCGFALISILGRDPFTSMRSALSLLLFSGLLFSFRTLARTHGPSTLLWALVLGQTIAAINTFLAAAFPESYPRVLIGKVSESGQLGISIFVAIGLLADALRDAVSLREKFLRLSPLVLLLLFLMSILALFSIDDLSKPIFLFSGGLMLLILGGLAWIACADAPGQGISRAWAIFFVSLPFLTCALLSNMKRGPWAGALVGALLFAFLYARRLMLAIIVTSAIILLSFAPIRERLLQSPEHFFISGGRSEIWQIGGELIEQYPLGLGLKNSRFLQQYSTTIPKELKHFHNNFLNVTAELGWLGLGLFLWWLYSVLRCAFVTETHRVLARSIACAIISWQVAGTVEYNFGDSEVLLIALLIIGVLSSLDAQAPLPTASAIEA